MSKTTTGWLGRIAACAGLTLAVQASAWADRAVDMSRGVTGISSELYGLHMLIFGICVAIAVAVFGAMIWSIIYHRKTRGAEPAKLSHSTRVEIAWTIIPIAILVAMAVPAADTLIRQDDTRGDDMTVTVTGYQWKWDFEYPESEVRYSSLRASQGDGAAMPASLDAVSDGLESGVNLPLVVPAGTTVRVSLTSNDVNHGWWIREFGRQRNAIPGHINEFSFRARAPGTYRGECTEFCGPPDTCVPITVMAVPPEEFEAWIRTHGADRPEPGPKRLLAGSPPGEQYLAAAFTQGRQLHARNCAACHQASGLGLRAAGFPPLAGTKVSKDEHIRVALHGRKGSAMAGFGPLLGDEEVAAIVTYQRNAWGNDTGDVVVPAEVAAAR